MVVTVDNNKDLQDFIFKQKLPSFIKDSDMRYVAVNDAYAEIHSSTPSILIGQKTSTLCDETVFGDREECERYCLVFGKDKTAYYNCEGTGLKTAIKLMRYNNGDDVPYVHGVVEAVPLSAHHFEDTKSHKPDKQTATHYEVMPKRELENAIEAMDLAIVVVKSDLEILHFNQAVLELWGLSRDEFQVGFNYIDAVDGCRELTSKYFSKSRWDKFKKDLTAEISNGRIFQREVELTDGTFMIFSVRPLSDGNRLICFYDITELKQRELELDKALADHTSTNEILQITTDAMAQGLIITRDFKILMANQVIREMMDVPEEFLKKGTSLEEYIDFGIQRGDYEPGASAKSVLDVLIANLEKTGRSTAERRGANGKWLRVDVRSREGGISIATYTDITEIHERELKLEKLVKQSELADRAKSEFLANMSHEIRTPMNGVLGMAELLAKTDLDTRQKTYTDVIMKSGTALLTIINDILDFSKIDAGQMALDPGPMDFGEAIEDIATLVSSRVNEKDLELIVRLEPDLPRYVIGDVGRIRQIITNILGNAVKFTEHGHVLVDVTGEKTNDGNVSISVRIEDTGIGIPARDLKKVFDKFSQVDASSTRRHEGTGLGLAITSRLVALMNGEIGVESELGQGTTFWFKLNLPASQHVTKKRKLAPSSFEGARVLIVDDNSVNRAILSEQLQSWNFDSCAASSGPEGLAVLEAAKAQGFNVDCIILDYHMPDMNGLDMAKCIRQNPNIAQTPIVMLTSLDTSGEEETMRKLKIQAHLMKPARTSMLLDAIVDVLHASNANDEELISLDETPDNSVTVAAELNASTLKEKAGGIDVLIAEDNDVNQIVFTQIMEEIGVNYKIVDNGEKAVEAWKVHDPKIIIMDVSMPIKNGFEATEEIRNYELESGTRTPIIGVTAHALRGDREKCMEAGMDDYLPKPVSPDKLAEKLHSWFHKAQEKIKLGAN